MSNTSHTDQKCANTNNLKNKMDTEPMNTESLLRERFLEYIPAAHQAHFDEKVAHEDIERLMSLTDTKTMIWHLYQSESDNQNQLHLKLYGSQQPTTLSDILPVLENFGVSVITSKNYIFDVAEQPVWMQEYELILAHVDTVDMQVVRSQFEDSLQEIWAGRVDNDSFNELVLTTKLDTYEVVVLRALSRYMHQARVGFSML